MKRKAKMLWQARDRNGTVTRFSKKPHYYDGMWLCDKNTEMDFPPSRALILLDLNPLLGLFSKFSLRRIK